MVRNGKRHLGCRQNKISVPYYEQHQCPQASLDGSMTTTRLAQKSRLTRLSLDSVFKRLRNRSFNPEQQKLLHASTLVPP